MENSKPLLLRRIYGSSYSMPCPHRLLMGMLIIRIRISGLEICLLFQESSSVTLSCQTLAVARIKSVAQRSRPRCSPSIISPSN